MLFDGEGEITRHPLEPLQGRHRAARYEFEVASKYLARSQFVFKDLAQSGDSFWFFLKDFLHDK